jgi:hypothetical protein
MLNTTETVRLALPKHGKWVSFVTLGFVLDDFVIVQDDWEEL